jgi:hypothetical protein
MQRHAGAFMSLFDWLLIAHLVGDFLLQTDGMAKNKATDWSWMLRHVGVYLTIMTVVLTAYALAHPVPLTLIVALLLFLAATHIVLDRRTFVQWWTELVGASPEHPWLFVVVDQVFHLLAVAVVAQVLVQANR